MIRSLTTHHRYGLLYMGYRKDREWWELIIALRKVAVVSIGTFGTLMGVVDLQAFVALGTVFLSIIIHLIGQPFDRTKPNSRRLHSLEFTALSICWLTFWGGLLFFLGQEKPGSVPAAVKILTTLILVGTNSVFLLYASFSFGREYLVDRKIANKRRTTKLQLSQDQANALAQIANPTQIAPMNNSNDDGDDNANESEIEEHNRPKKCKLIGLKATQLNGRTGIRTRFIKTGEAIGRYIVLLDGEEEPTSGTFWPINIQLINDGLLKRQQSELHAQEAQDIHSHFELHEEGLRTKTEERQKRSKRKTNLRVLARKKIKQTKALLKVKLFEKLKENVIGNILDQCVFKRWKEKDVVCHQGEVADRFFIIVVGECKISIKASEVNNEQLTNSSDFSIPNASTKDKLKEVCQLHELDYFGESSLVYVNRHDVNFKLPVRNATVEVISPMMDTLSLTNEAFQKLLASGVIDSSVMQTVIQTRSKRNDENRQSLADESEAKVVETETSSTTLENIVVEQNENEYT